MRTRDEVNQELNSIETAAMALRCELGRIADQEDADLRAAGKSNCHGVWRTDGSCSYCGSMTAAEAIRRLVTPGTRYSGADWKYGFPHKFYIELGDYPHKFYNNHLADASPAEFAAFSALSETLFGVIWFKEESVNPGLSPAIKWKAPRGIQNFGTIGVLEGKPENPPGEPKTTA